MSCYRTTRRQLQHQQRSHNWQASSPCSSTATSSQAASYPQTGPNSGLNPGLNPKGGFDPGAQGVGAVCELQQHLLALVAENRDLMGKLTATHSKLKGTRSKLAVAEAMALQVCWGGGAGAKRCWGGSGGVAR